MKNTLYKMARKLVEVPPLPPPPPEPECRIERITETVPDMQDITIVEVLAGGPGGQYVTNIRSGGKVQVGWKPGYRIVRVCSIPPIPRVPPPKVTPIPARWDATARSIGDGVNTLAVGWTVYPGNRDTIVGLSRLTGEPSTNVEMFGAEEVSKGLRSAVMQGFRVSGSHIFVHEVPPPHYSTHRGTATIRLPSVPLNTGGSHCRIEHRPTEVRYFVDDVLVASGPSFALRGEALHLRAVMFGLQDEVDEPYLEALEINSSGAAMLAPLSAKGGRRSEGRAFVGPLFIVGPERRQGEIRLAPLHAYGTAREPLAHIELPPPFVWGWGHIGNNGKGALMLPPLAVKGGEPGGVARLLLAPLGLYARGNEYPPMIFATPYLDARWSAAIRPGNSAISVTRCGIGVEFEPGLVRTRPLAARARIKSAARANYLWSEVVHALVAVQQRCSLERIIDVQVGYQVVAGAPLLTITVLTAQLQAGVVAGDAWDFARLADTDLRAGLNVAGAFSTIGEFNRALRAALQVIAAGALGQSESAAWSVRPDGASAAWSVRPDGASTSYSGFGFNSFARIGDAVFAAGEDGLYELGGDDDAGVPIEARVALGQRDFGSSLLKHISNAYLSVGSDGAMVVQVRLPDGSTYSYPARRGDAQMRTQRVDFGRGLRATYFDLELRNQAGGDFELDRLEFVVAPSKRRI